MNRMTAEMDTRGISAIECKTIVVEDITNERTYQTNLTHSQDESVKVITTWLIGYLFNRQTVL
jgi:hypothetical protein